MDIVMKLISSTAIAGAVLVLGFAAPAQALSNRAWVSGHGINAAGCGSAVTPCATLQYVVTNIIAPGGEIDVLDAGDYGPVTIPFALKIFNDSAGVATVLQPAGGQFAITINAGANDAVFLRGLTIDGLGIGHSGIQLNTGGALIVVNFVARHFGGHGIWITPSSGATNVYIANTIASDNGASGIALEAPRAGTFTGVISQTTVANNGLANRGDAGILIFGGRAATIVDTVVFHNPTGILARNGAALRIGRSVVTGNGPGAGVEITSPATGQSYGDNKIDGNTFDILPAGALSPPIAMK